MSETVPEVPAEPAAPEPAPEPPAEPEAAPEPSPEPDAPQETEAAPADHAGLLHELAGFIRDVAANDGTIHEALAWILSHGL